MTNLATISTNTKWRLLMRVIMFWGGYAAILVIASLAKSVVPQHWGPLIWGLVSSAMIWLLTLAFLRRENRQVRDVGLDFDRKSFQRLFIGVFVGLAVFGLQVLAVSLIAGPIHFSRSPGASPDTIATAVSTIFALSCMEELGFRGYPLRTLMRDFGLWPAQGMVAVAFGLCHFAYGWSWLAILLGVVPSALLFGMIAISSRGLAMPIGVHAGVNLAQSSLSNNSNWGIWKLVMDNHVRGEVATVSPIVGVVTVTSAMLIFWWWHRGRQGDEIGSNAKPSAAPNDDPATLVGNSGVKDEPLN